MHRSSGSSFYLKLLNTFIIIANLCWTPTPLLSTLYVFSYLGFQCRGASTIITCTVHIKKLNLWVDQLIKARIKIKMQTTQSQCNWVYCLIMWELSSSGTYSVVSAMHMIAAFLFLKRRHFCLSPYVNVEVK